MNKINFQNGILVAKAKVTINGIVYEVEPAEYEGTTPLNAENLNQIQTNAENAINTVQGNLNTTNQNIENLTTYSTTEKVVGKWKDDKTLYEKMISLVPTTTNPTEVSHNIENVDKIWVAEGSFLWVDGTSLPVNYYRGQDYIYTHATKTKVVTKISANGWLNNTMEVTIRYTKTTD